MGLRAGWQDLTAVAASPCPDAPVLPRKLLPRTSAVRWYRQYRIPAVLPDQRLPPASPAAHGFPALPCRADHIARESPLWHLWSLRLCANTTARSAAVTVRRSGANTAPTTSTIALAKALLEKVGRRRSYMGKRGRQGRHRQSLLEEGVPAVPCCPVCVQMAKVELRYPVPVTHIRESTKRSKPEHE